MPALMPSLFVGHGSPMNLVLENSYTEALSTLSTTLPLPKAILVISAHWYTTETAVSVASGISYPTLYDFYGFPQALYERSYPSPSNNTLSKKIASLLGISMVERGLDHGAWMPLSYLFPKASIPVLQLSINKSLSMQEHVAIGMRLRELREEGIMLIGSGNLTHNLGMVDFYTMNAPAVDWAQRVDAFIETAVMKHDITSLVNIASLCPDFTIAHPSIDHYLPLLYIIGAMDADEKRSSITPIFQNASLSMRGFISQF